MVADFNRQTTYNNHVGYAKVDDFYGDGEISVGEDLTFKYSNIKGYRRTYNFTETTGQAQLDIDTHTQICGTMYYIPCIVSYSTV